MFTLIALSLLSLVAVGLWIWQIVHIAGDSKITGENTALWVILTVLFSSFGFAIYKLVTKKVGEGVFWLIGYPIIVSIIVGIAIFLDAILLSSM